MSTEQTAEEIRQQYVVTMGEELGQQYHLLRDQCQWAHVKWNEFVELFGTNSGRIDLLNESAPRLFRIIQDALWEDMLLLLCRVTDRPAHGKKENLTIQNFSALVVPEIRAALDLLVNKAEQKTEFARDWRNRRIAHKDLSLALQTSSNSLTPGSRAHVKSALNAIANVLNCIEGHYCGGQVMYGGFGPAQGAKALLYYLREGIKSEAARRQRLRSGQFPPEDIGPRKDF
jgi:hypothetical protein